MMTEANVEKQFFHYQQLFYAKIEKTDSQKNDNSILGIVRKVNGATKSQRAQLQKDTAT